MYIGKVIGNIVSTKKEESLTGMKFMIVDIIKNHKNSEENKIGSTIVAVDLVGAGRDEYVLISTGSSARIASGKEQSPVDATIVGIIDIFE